MAGARPDWGQRPRLGGGAIAPPLPHAGYGPVYCTYKLTSRIFIDEELTRLKLSFVLDKSSSKLRFFLLLIVFSFIKFIFKDIYTMIIFSEYNYSTLTQLYKKA